MYKAPSSIISRKTALATKHLSSSSVISPSWFSVPKIRVSLLLVVVCFESAKWLLPWLLPLAIQRAILLISCEFLADSLMKSSLSQHVEETFTGKRGSCKWRHSGKPIIGGFGTHVDNSTSNFTKTKMAFGKVKHFFLVGVTKSDVDNCKVGC